MDSAVDIADIVVKAVARFAESVEGWLHIPWPIAVAVLFLPIVGLLNIAVWYLRGTLFPIRCAYPTARKAGCRNVVLGEWHKCRLHRKAIYRKTDLHTVDPKRNRWEYRTIIDGSEATPVGRGFLRMHSGRDTLLFKKGFCRRPSQVLDFLPDLAKGVVERTAHLWRQSRTVGIAGLFKPTSEARVISTSEVLPHVVRASRTVLASTAAGLALVGLAELLTGTPQLVLQFGATFALVFAVMAGRRGILRHESGWPRRSFRETARCMTSFTAIATIGGLLELHGDDIRRLLLQVVELLIPMAMMLIILWLAIGETSGKQRSRLTSRTTRRKKRSRR